ncbi:MAG TPA: serine hydrolase [Flavobacteriaceae bacterium]|nr:serine hydrolase [Flavobacteriaceae bacterium]
MKFPCRSFLLILFISFLLSSCTLGRFVWYNFADIDDYKIFPYRTIEKPETPFEFSVAEPPKAPSIITVHGKNYEFEKYLEDNKTVAFIIIRNDTIMYENYWHHYDEASVVPSFSMAKSVVSILIGCAIDDGIIESIDEPITNYIPEMKSSDFENVTIKHLLQMTSGLDFYEGYYNPFGKVARFYYGQNLKKASYKLKLDNAPGEKFQYRSGNSQLLGLVLESALKGKTISDYLEEKLWLPLGMEYDASWSLDQKDGVEKTFCCLNARARDFAKIGRLYLNKGNWNGKQIVSEKWVENSTMVDTSDGSSKRYQYQWWLPSPDGDFMAQGILGQYIYVNPKSNVVIVRLGKKDGKANWWNILTVLGEAYGKSEKS